MSEVLEPMSEADRLLIYDALREFHKVVKAIFIGNEHKLSSWQENALDAVDSVLYLAEGVFASEEN